MNEGISVCRSTFIQLVSHSTLIKYTIDYKSHRRPLIARETERNMSWNYYPKNFKANGWGWHRTANATSAVRGFLSGERGGGSTEPLIGNGSLYPTLPAEDDTTFRAGGLYPALPAEEYESGAVEEVVEEACASVNVNLVRTSIMSVIWDGKRSSSVTAYPHVS
ncbi:unnamed protein product, partial [Iphiclides podalirius]